MSLTDPFVLHFDCCYCIMCYQEQHCEAKRTGTGRNFTIVSHQQSTRFTRRGDLDRGQSTNTLLCGSLFVCFKQSWQLYQKMSHTLHQILSFSSAPRWPLATRPFDTCCLHAPVKQLVTIWWRLNRAVLPTSSTCVEGEAEEALRVGSGQGGMRRVTEKSRGVWRQIRQPDSDFAPLLLGVLTPSCLVASMTPKGHEGSHRRNLEPSLKKLEKEKKY